jgi:hypothetical protein
MKTALIRLLFKSLHSDKRVSRFLVEASGWVLCVELKIDDMTPRVVMSPVAARQMRIGSELEWSRRFAKKNATLAIGEHSRRERL